MSQDAGRRRVRLVQAGRVKPLLVRAFPFALVVAIALGGFIGWATGANDKPAPAPTLAERINAACPVGHKLNNWYVSDTELIRVECYRVKWPYTIKYIAVAR